MLASLAVGSAALAAMGLLGAVPAAAAGNGRFAIAPTSAGATSRTVFTPLLGPGQTSSDSVVVVNETAQPITLHLYPADAYTSKSGEFVLQPDFKPKLHMGAWIHLPTSQVTVPAKSGDVVPFTYDPPGNVSPGDYAGGIVAEQIQGAVSQHGPLHLAELQAVGTAVYGRINGPLHPRLEVTAVAVTVTRPIASQFGGSVDATVTYSITNTGNESLTPAVTVSLSPLVGGGPSARHARLPQILPGSTVTFTKTFDGVVPFGHLGATVTARAAGVTATGNGGTAVVPWGLVAIVALVVLAVLYRRRRRRRARQLGAAGPTSAGGAAVGGSPGGGGAPSPDAKPAPVDAGVPGGGSGGP